jgi:tRNA U34 5-methylaminomethyl-2-thiouridine-forming methyltransferase MnmC
MNLKIEITGDGSHTISVEELNEHYHSIHGAIRESQHIFIEAGLKYSIKEKNKINILEIGFGTGLNALLTFLELSKQNIFCDFISIEKFPLEENMYIELNYPEILNIPKEIFLSLHNSAWNERVKISDNFFLRKICCDAINMNLSDNFFDVIYFDAFGPDKQPEIWSKNIFSTIFRSMKLEAVLVTYSTKGDVKRILKETGYKIEKLPGPKGKREILRGVK